MTALGSENYVTEYDYNNALNNYTGLLQKETKTTVQSIENTVYIYDKSGNQITKTSDSKTETNTPVLNLV